MVTHLELVLVDARVDDKEEDGRRGLGAGEGVLDGREVLDQLHREVCLGHPLVVRRELVAAHAERADPHLADKVNLAAWQRGRVRISQYGAIDWGVSGKDKTIQKPFRHA
jgi:hypothetical protein